MPNVASIVGRRQELAKIDQALDEARAGHGGILLLAGEAGVGKTRLADEAIRRSGFVAHVGRAREVTPSYGPIVSVLRSCRRSADAPMDGPLQAYLGLLLPEIRAQPVEADAATLAEAIGDLLAASATRAPTLVLLDDLHWADEATLDAIPVLVERLARERLLILGTYRSDEIPHGHSLRRLRSELRRIHHLSEVIVEPLTPQESATLIERTLARPPAESLASRIHAQTNGVPLYVEELCAALADRRLLRDREGRCDLIPGKPLPIPESIRDAVVLRLDGLTDAARQQLEVAAVIGQEFDPGLVAEIGGSDEALPALFEGRLLVELESGRAAFRHAMIREAVRAEITWSRRRELHRRVAASLAGSGARPERVADHWLAARELTRAREALIESADLACRVHAYRDAARAAHRALEIWPPHEEESERVEVLERLAHCAQVTGALGDAARALREVLQSAVVRDDPRRLAGTLRTLASISALQGTWKQAVDAWEGAANAFERAGMPAEAAEELMAAAERHATSARYGRALRTVGRAVELAERSGRVDLAVRAAGQQGFLLAVRGDGQQGRQKARAALDLALSHGLTEAASEAHRRLANALAYSSDYGAAREAFAEAARFCRAQGEDESRRLCLGCMSWVLFQAGDWPHAMEIGKEVIDSAETAAGLRSIALGVLGMVHACRGEVRSARKFLHESLDLTRHREFVPMELIVLGGLAYVDEQEDQQQVAAERYGEMIDRWSSSEDHLDAINGLYMATSFYTSHNDEPQTTRCIEALTRMAATGNPEARAALAFGLGEAEMMHARHEAASAFYSRSLSHLEQLELPLRQAYAEFRAGVALSRSGQRDPAIAYLRNAHRLARQLGARPLASQVVSALNGLQARVEEQRSPQGNERAARAGLTQRQLEVARLISQGLTNREIGQRLFVSTRTVDMHVRNLLDRLNCRTRTEAVRKAGSLGLLD